MEDTKKQVTEFHILTTEILKDEVEFSTSLKGIN